MSFPARPAALNISRRGLLALGLVLATPWAILIWVVGRMPPSPSSPPPRASAAPAAGQAQKSDLGTPGPWGQLEYSRILIEPPEAFVPAEYGGASELRWVFKGFSAAALDDLWQRAGLAEAQKKSLSDPARREISAAAIVVHPEFDLVLGLAPEARAVIYAALAEFTENPAQNDPFRFQASVLDDWFDNSGLPEDIIALTKRLIYRRDAIALFSDYDLVLPKLASPAMRSRFLKTISRKSALLAQLRVRSDTDVNALASYWGKGHRSKDLKPLLQSLAQRPGGGRIDIVHLLPPFARSLLYTYPLPSDRGDDAARDCHWTSFNFYNEVPDEKFTSIEQVKQTLLNSYYQVVGAPEFGDIIILLQPDGVVVHSCVYVADDIVFTKNGASFSVPWLLGRLENVVSFYSLRQPLEVRRYRAKDR